MFLKRNGAVAHDPIKAETGDMKHILRRQYNRLAGIGHIGVGQDAVLIPVYSQSSCPVAEGIDL